MKYGLSRAVPMGILGFLIGMLLAFVLRSWQGIDPAWDPEVGIVLGAIGASVLFVWSMGAFDPAMSAHGEEHHEEEHHEPHPAHPAVSFTERLHGALKSVIGVGLRVQDSILGGPWWLVLLKLIYAIVVLLILLIPIILLGLLLLLVNVVNLARSMASDVFLVTTIVLVVLLFISVIAFWPGGFTIPITNDPVGAPTGNGFITINLFGTDFVFTKLTLFLIFVIWTVVSLAAAGGAISLLMSYLAREVRSVKGKAPSAEALVPPKPLRLLSRGATWLLARLPEPPKPQR
ncbi:MAG: hypothetical protein U0694_29110 [Anaerolineae bacterium]